MGVVGNGGTEDKNGNKYRERSVQGAVSPGRGEAFHIMLIRGKFCSCSRKKKEVESLQ